VSHIFVSPHPDDAALSCGGLIANLRELGQNVIILSVYSGHGDLDRLTSYQRQALGFGGKAIWPATQAFDSGSIAADNAVPGETADALAPWQAEPARLKETQREADESAKEFWQRASWYRRADISATSLPGGRTRDTSNGQGVLDPGAVAVAVAAGEAMAQRRVGGVDHAARRAPVGAPAAAFVAHQQQPIDRLDQRAGNRPLDEAHRPSLARERYLPRRKTRSRTAHHVTSRNASTTMRLDILERPRLRSRKVIGTSAMWPPTRSVR